MTKINFKFLHQSLQQILLKFDDSLQQMDFRNRLEIRLLQICYQN